MRIIVGNPISPPPKKINSHVRGWSYHWSSTCNAEIAHNDFEWPKERITFLFDHGVNFGGGLNLFGGLGDAVAISIKNFVESWNPNSVLLSCDIDMPDYHTMLIGRLGANSTSKLINEEILIKFGNILKTARTLKQNNLKIFNKICIGDSHTAAFTADDSAGLRKNGQTLFGAIKSGYLYDTVVNLDECFDSVTVCLGSIDIRHHLGRLDSPILQAKKLAYSYLKEIDRIRSERPLEIELCYPVPVEHEGRKIPKTGYYKGEPFFGSRELRLDLTMAFSEVLFSESRIVSPPQEWYRMDGEHFAKKYMEFGGSVHLSPEYYRRLDWGQRDQEVPLDSIFG